MQSNIYQLLMSCTQVDLNHLVATTYQPAPGTDGEFQICLALKSGPVITTEPYINEVAVKDALAALNRAFADFNKPFDSMIHLKNSSDVFDVREIRSAATWNCDEREFWVRVYFKGTGSYIDCRKSPIKAESTQDKKLIDAKLAEYAEYLSYRRT